MSYVSEILSESNLLAFYKCTETSGLAQDSSGNGRHMTGDNNPGPAKRYRMTGPITGAFGIGMNGGSNFDRVKLTTAIDNWTMMLWFQFEAAGGADCLLVNGSRTAHGWALDYNTNGHFRALYGGVAWETDSVISLGTSWHHITVVRDAGTTKYYADGAVDRSNAGTDVPNTVSTDRFAIGSDGQVQGVFCGVAVFDKVVSPTRIATIAGQTEFEAASTAGLSRIASTGFLRRGF